MIAKVTIAGSGSYLPGPPIPSAGLDSVLGAIPGLSPSLEGRARRMQEAVLKRTGVRRRHYALDPATRAQTETNVSIMEKAVRATLDMAAIEPASVDLLVTSGPMADFACPPTSALLQGRLGIEKCAEIEIHSNCTGTPKALQIAFDMLRVGRYRRAIVAYGQLSSVFLRAEYYTPDKVGLENLALRWIMSDGAGALVLERGGDGVELLDVHVESIGGLDAPGMSGFAMAASPTITRSPACACSRRWPRGCAARGPGYRPRFPPRPRPPRRWPRRHARQRRYRRRRYRPFPARHPRPPLHFRADHRPFPRHARHRPARPDGFHPGRRFRLLRRRHHAGAVRSPDA
ncbi:MAG: hypothetical protein IPL47_12525, partial [Phyllobacteriaceae bacterium]|nr:hypothetical protein [Phyllobacteriaceae bacterium]